MAAQEAYKDAPAKVRLFLEDNCYDCHSGSSSEAGFDIEELSDELTKSNAADWTQVFDRVESNEMPPPDAADIDREDRKKFLQLNGK